MLDVTSYNPADQSSLVFDPNAGWSDAGDPSVASDVDTVAAGRRAFTADNLSSAQTWAAAADALAPPAMATAAGDVIGAVERGFSGLIGLLGREFGALEQRFAGALRSLFGTAGSAVAAAKAANGKAQTVGARGDGDAASGASAPSPYDGLIRRAAARHQLDPSLVKAVMRQESGFRPDARSDAGAVGLMQLMPQTAASLGVSDPLDPAQNVDGGARLLRSLLDRFGGRVDLAVAAYNAGPSAVDRYGGVPPYPETQAYVRAVLSHYRADALSASS